MPWKKQRNGRTYFYLSRREGGRVVSEYVGGGRAGEMAARRLEEIKREREAERMRIEQAKADEAEEIAQALAVARTFRASMNAAGFAQHNRGEWRMAADAATSNRLTKAEALDLFLRAQGGDDTALPALEAHLDSDDPKAAKFVDYHGDEARRALVCMIEKNYGAKNRLQPEIITRKAAKMRAELEGPDPTLLERLLAGRVVAAWFYLHIKEMKRDQSDSKSIREIEFLDRMVDRAQRRFLSASKALETIRRFGVGGAGDVTLTATARMKARSGPPAIDVEAVERLAHSPGEPHADSA